VGNDHRGTAIAVRNRPIDAGKSILKALADLVDIWKARRHDGRAVEALRRI